VTSRTANVLIATIRERYMLYAVPPDSRRSLWNALLEIAVWTGKGEEVEEGAGEAAGRGASVLMLLL
jgi:hypothetical protein